MKDIEEDHTPVRHSFTPLADIRQAAIRLSAQLTVIVDKTVFSTSHIFLESAAVGTVQLPVSIIRVDQETINDVADSFVARWIVGADLF